MLITHEIQEVSKFCENLANSKIVSSVEQLIRIELKQTKSRHLTIVLRFPEGYPNQKIFIELKSRTLHQKFLDGLANIAEEKAKECLGKPQAIIVLKFITQYLAENPLFVVLHDEILAVKKLLHGTNFGSLKLKQKTSSLVLNAQSGRYYFRIKSIIPEEYPEKCVQWRDYESNLPNVLIQFLNGQSKEIARQCVEPPLQKQDKNAEIFRPSPSVFKTFQFIIEALKEFCHEICPICKNTVLPEKPEDIISNDMDDMYVERVYCGHLFHQACLKNYMQTPPFPSTGCKTCPALKRHPRSDCKHLPHKLREKNRLNLTKAKTNCCGIPLAHDRWVISVKVAEARWAQKQARQRELQEVVDFLQ